MDVEKFDINTKNGDASNSGDRKDRKTSPFMTKFELARLAGTRALQLSMNAPVTIAVPSNETDPLKIALLELKARTLPLIVRRYLPDGSFEDWPVSDLIITHL